MIKKSNTLLATITFMAAMVTVQPTILAQTLGVKGVKGVTFDDGQKSKLKTIDMQEWHYTSTRIKTFTFNRRQKSLTPLTP